MSRDFKGKRVTVLGLGVLSGGAASARYFAARGADVTVTDLLPAEALRKSMDALAQWPVRYVLGEHREEDITGADLVVVGPAVRDDSPYLRLARERGVPLTTEINLVFETCRRPVIGITGSNGKTTTTRLLGAFYQAFGPDTLIGGNIGRAVLNELEDSGGGAGSGIDADLGGAVDGQDKVVESGEASDGGPVGAVGIADAPLTGEAPAGSPVILELSSFQLHRLAWIRLSPVMAVVTNLSPNHLDWHGTFDAYEQAKRHIVHYQSPEDVVVLNADDERLRNWAAFCPGRVAWFSMEGPVETGCYVRDGHVVYRDGSGRRGGPERHDASKAGGAAAERDPAAEDLVCTVDVLRLPGPHNLANLLAAVTAACLGGIPASVIRSTVEAFLGVEHRLEKVAVIDGVGYYNDSACTTPASTVTALRAFDAPVVLIAGGYDKGTAFDDMASKIVRRARAAVLIGSTADAIETAIGKASAGPAVVDSGGVNPVAASSEVAKSAGMKSPVANPPVIVRADTLEDAVRKSAGLARPGDVVVLSPACASYDMFTNFEERGQRFKEAVAALK